MGEAYDFDLFTIGAGSGGVAASRRAAAHGVRVGIAEASRVGGTCVIRGCVPKKLLVYAGQFRDAFDDAAGFELGDAVALEDKAGHGFEVTTPTLVAKLGPKTFRLGQPAESDYLITRGAEAKHAISGIAAINVKNAAVIGVTIEGNHGDLWIQQQIKSEPLFFAT